MKEFLSIGQIINTHGLKGELKVYPLTDDMRRYRKLDSVIIDGIERKTSWCKLQNELVILKIEGIDTVEDAIKYKDKYIYVNRKDAVKLPSGNYFIADIIGCNVVDENGINLGLVADVIKTGSNDVYLVKGDKEILIPALKSVVVNIDVINQKIVVKPVELWN